jgi:plasmid stabilization system protein ParE
MTFEKAGKTLYELIVTEEAKNDIRRISEAYEETSAYSAEKFESAIDTVISLLEEYPGLAHEYEPYPEIKYRSIPKYPFALYFRIIDNQMQIIAFGLISHNAGDNYINKVIIERLQ